MAALGRALVRELRRPPGIRSIVLGAIRDIAKTQPTMFAGRLGSFFIIFKDSLECRKTKLEIISLLANRGNVTTILKEFESYVLFCGLFDRPSSLSIYPPRRLAH